MRNRKRILYRESFKAYGHPNIKSTHRTTLEVTTHSSLTPQGDCVIAVRSTKSANTLSSEIKTALKHPKSRVQLIVTCHGETDSITGEGNSRLTLTHPSDLVCRKSMYIDDRTFIVNACKAAIDLKPSLIEKIKKPDALIEFDLQVEIPT